MVEPQSDRAMSERPAQADTKRRIPTPGGLRLGLLLAWVPVLALGVVATFDPTGGTAGSAWAAGLTLIGLTLAAGVHDLRAADARTHDALGRAVAAETAQRARADELADILRASQGLVLMGEGKLDFVGILASITPSGATSFLTQIGTKSESVVVAAHGPLAPWFIGLRRPPEAVAETGSSLTSYSARGRVVGVATPPIHVPGLTVEIEAALGIRFADHDGKALGWLHLLDPAGQRILEPAFVGLAQLVGNQIGVAMENQALLLRAQRQVLEVQRVQQQLVQVTKLGAVGELAAAVAHEVNNPLTGILGFSELLLAELPPDDPRHQEASIIQSEAVRARAIVRSLLEFARPRAPQRIPTDLNELARSTLDLVRFRAEEASIWVTEDYGELPCLEIDPDAFKQVMLNLLNNALEAMPRGGQLRVATRLAGERISLTIADSGVGMDERTRSRIFTPFFTTRAGNAGGTGLGLSVSLQIVEGHGGSIDVQTEPGRGSAFTVWLPTTWEAFDGSVIVPGMDRPGAGAADTRAEDADQLQSVCSDAGDGQARGSGAAA
jgi:signal transduction histidine kinase